MSSQPDSPSIELPEDDRERMLELLEDGIREAHAKVQNGRVRDPENEKVRIKWVKALAQSVSAYRRLKRDADLERLEDRIDRIEDR